MVNSFILRLICQMLNKVLKIGPLKKSIKDRLRRRGPHTAYGGNFLENNKEIKKKSLKNMV